MLDSKQAVIRCGGIVASRFVKLQIELEVSGTRDRIEAIRFGRLEAQRFVERLRALHRWKSVEKHPLIAARSGFRDKGYGELTTNTKVAPGRSDVKPLHLAFRLGESPERAAAEKLVALSSE